MVVGGDGRGARVGTGGARHTCGVATAAQRVKALAVDIFERLVEYVEARVNRSLQRFAMRDYAAASGRRVIRVVEAQGLITASQVRESESKSKSERD